MNLFEKIQAIRVELREQNLKPTGKNEFAKYSYFELDDFLPQLNRLMQKHNMTAIASFTSEIASLTAINIEAPEERFLITSPFSSASLKGCHEVQCVGAVETYQRRYLYQALFDIGEKDGLDGTFNPQEPKTQQSRGNTQLQQNKQQNENKGVKTDMSLEEAKNYSFTSGKNANTPFSKLPADTLKWIKENAYSADARTAATLVLEYMGEMAKELKGETKKQMTVADLEPVKDEELPF